MGGTDEIGNLITLCGNCHAAHHPQLQMKLSGRTLGRIALKLARLLLGVRRLPKQLDQVYYLLSLFGVKRLRPHQFQVVMAAIQGRDVLCISPTGSGKSLCFQIPGLLKVGTTLVLSPLKALMSDQVSGLLLKRLTATFLNSDVGKKEKALRLEALCKGHFKFLYCAPERFWSPLVAQEEKELLNKIAYNYLVVDEAHCVNQWGNDFRPAYGQIGEIASNLGSPQILAFTATASRFSQQGIIQSLRMKDPLVITTGVDRPNIALYRIALTARTKNETFDERVTQIANFLRYSPKTKALIYVPTKDIGLKLQKALQECDLNTEFFHGRLDRMSSETILQRFKELQQPAINHLICTSAFGMGIDIPNIRLVIHWQAPASPEDYLQEFGRAGRDGRPSVAIVFHHSTDYGLLEFMAKKSVESPNVLERERRDRLRERLRQIDKLQNIVTNSNACFREMIVECFEDRKINRRKPITTRIIEWLFVENSRRQSKLIWVCCDYCDGADAIETALRQRTNSR